MSKLINLTQKEFIGQTVPKDVDEFYDYKRQGSYKIHIPELMPHLEKDKGIWCKNHTNKWNITPSDVGEYGSHYPLQPGTYVIVKFFDNDINSGYVDRILSDYKKDRDVEAQDNVKAIPSIEDRDEQYLVFKTPKKWNAFYINEDTTNEPNTIYLIYNRDNNPKRRTVYRIDETGVHIWTRDNMRVRLSGDENYQIDGDRTGYVKNDQQENIDGDDDHKVKGDVTVEIKGDADVSVDGTVNLWSGSNINVDASPNINLNCGIANRTPAKQKIEVKDLGPNETSEYKSGVGKGCDSATDDYNVEKRDNEKMIPD